MRPADRQSVGVGGQPFGPNELGRRNLSQHQCIAWSASGLGHAIARVSLIPGAFTTLRTVPRLGLPPARIVTGFVPQLIRRHDGFRPDPACQCCAGRISARGLGCRYGSPALEHGITGSPNAVPFPVRGARNSSPGSVKQPPFARPRALRMHRPSFSAVQVTEGHAIDSDSEPWPLSADIR
jgi:hypothetical protein